MASLKDIRKRITSVKNTQKITRAMKLVAAAKLRRAQEAIVAARPYAQALEDVVVGLSAGAGEDAHPLLMQREGKRAEIVLLTSDRGLAGSYNAQIIRFVENFVAEDLADYSDVSLRIVGTKGRDYFRRRSANICGDTPAPKSTTALADSRELANLVVEDYVEEKVDKVFLVYNEFKSAITQDVVVKQLLPIAATDAPEGEPTDAPGDEFVYEPSKEVLLDHLLPLYIQTGLYRATLESIASEFGARMSAMESATRNAGEMIDALSLKYNRARQAAITTELLEIIAGAESLKG